MAGEEVAALRKVREDLGAFGRSLNDLSRIVGGAKQSLEKEKEEAKKITDVHMKLAGVYKYQIQDVQENIKAFESFRQRISNLGQDTGSTTKLMTTLSANLRGLQISSAAAGISFKGLIKNQQLSTGVEGERLGSIKSGLAALAGPAEKSLKALNFLSPAMAESTQKTAASAANFRILAGGLGIGAMLIQAVISGIGKLLQGGVQVNRVMMGTFKTIDTGMGRSISLYSKMNLAGAVWGVKQEEQIGLLNTLTDTYALNARNQADLTNEGSAAAVKSLALGKAMNLSTEASAQLIATFKLFGGTLESMPGEMANFKFQSESALMTTRDMAAALATITPVSLMVSRAHERHMFTLAAFARNFDTSMIKVGDGSTAVARFQNAMKAFTQQSAQMQLPELLAFGGGLAPGAPGQLSEAMKTAVGTPLGNIFVNMGKQIMGSVLGSKDEQIAALATFYSQQKGIGMSTALDLARLVSDIDTKSMKISKGATEQEKRNHQEALEKLTLISNLVEDPQQKIINILQAILGNMIAMMTRFGGGGIAGAAVSGMLGAARMVPGSSMSATAGTGK